MSDSYGDLWILGSVVLIGVLVRLGLGAIARLQRAARAEEESLLLRGRHAARDREEDEEEPVPESGVRLKTAARPSRAPERSA